MLPLFNYYTSVGAKCPKMLKLKLMYFSSCFLFHTSVLFWGINIRNYSIREFLWDLSVSLVVFAIVGPNFFPFYPLFIQLEDRCIFFSKMKKLTSHDQTHNSNKCFHIMLHFVEIMKSIFSSLTLRMINFK